MAKRMVGKQSVNTAQHERTAGGRVFGELRTDRGDGNAYLVISLDLRILVLLLLSINVSTGLERVKGVDESRAEQSNKRGSRG